ncbi:MAG: cupin domain-containing protein [Actinomycetota bacterium]
MSAPADVTPADIIERLGMSPHPEGGHYVETWRGAPGADGRAIGTAIHFLLQRGERSHWHRVDADEMWIHNAGSGIELSLAPSDAGPVDVHRLSGELDADGAAQVLVPAGSWQAARPVGEWGLVTCVVVPGFDFDGFELAAPGWEPGHNDSAVG